MNSQQEPFADSQQDAFTHSQQGAFTHSQQGAFSSSRQESVNAVFSSVASRYDLMNDVMSFGVHRFWKKALVSYLNPPKGEPFHVLDVASGSGDIALEILKRTERVHVTLTDINPDMLKEAEGRLFARFPDRTSFDVANAESLPFENGTFDAVTIAFGIRNVPNRAKALSEFYRVLKPKGRLFVLEFSHVDVPVVEEAYAAYSRFIPHLGGLIAKDKDAYAYLVESIRAFPSKEAFATLMTDVGFQTIYKTFTFGVVCLHCGTKGAA